MDALFLFLLGIIFLYMTISTDDTKNNDSDDEDNFV